MEPPNPDVATMDPLAVAGKRCSAFDTALHCGQCSFMNAALPAD